MKLSVILAARNEEENIPKLVSELLKTLNKYILEIIVVNDVSTDGTASIVKDLMKKYRKVKLINRLPPPGVGRAIRTGFANISKKCDWVLTMDSDFISNVPEIIPMLEQVGQNDGVIGSRYMPKGKLVNYPFLKMVSNRIYHLLLRLMLGINQYDLTNNFKLYKREIITSIKWQSDDFAINAETGLFPILKGYKIVEVPVSWTQRSYGKSHFKVFKLAPSYIKVFFRALTRNF